MQKTPWGIKGKWKIAAIVRAGRTGNGLFHSPRQATKLVRH
jgi:hypothetical protein